MAEENQDGQEKTEEPTAKRLAQSKEEGQLLQSKEVMIFTTTVTGLILLMALMPFYRVGLSAWGSLFTVSYTHLTLPTIRLV